MLNIGKGKLTTFTQKLCNSVELNLERQVFLGELKKGIALYKEVYHKIQLRNGKEKGTDVGLKAKNFSNFH